TLAAAFFRLFEPFCFLLRFCWAFLSFRSARRRNRGLSITVPCERTANQARPRSIPTSVSASGNRSRSSVGSVTTTKDAKYRPDASRITVTDDGTEGNSRDQATATSPILGSRNLPSDST